MIRGLIFDFDGVLVDTEPLHMQAWQDILDAAKIFFEPHTDDSRYIGLNDRDFLDKVLAENKTDWSPAQKKEAILAKEKLSTERFAITSPVMPGADAFLRKQAALYPMALVTGGLPNEVHYIVDHMKWRPLFQTIITSADVIYGKPNPEGFLKAHAFFQNNLSWNPDLKPAECLVFEDSNYGMEAARRAGMPFVQICKTWDGVTIPLNL